MAVGAARRPVLVPVAAHRARAGRADPVALLAQAERHRHLEHVLAAVLGLHAARVTVDVAVRAARRLGHAPARLPAVSGRLAVFLRRPHHALSAAAGAKQTGTSVTANGCFEY